MKIADDDIEIDGRVGDLLERGLLRYGEGDLEGALSHWKHALILDPDNEKAAHYARYVEDNHDLADASTSPVYDPQAELTYPFGLEELGMNSLEGVDDYESFEICAPDPGVAASSTSAAVDDGWNVDESWASDLVGQGEAAFSASAEKENEAAVAKDEADFSDLSLDDSIDRAPSAVDEFEQPEAETTPLASIANAFEDFELAGYQGQASGAPEVGYALEDGSVDEELTIEHARPGQRPFGKRKGLALPDPNQPVMSSRAPTQDPGLASVPVRVDEALLSLEDSTGEIALGDLSDLRMLSEETTRSVLVAPEASAPEGLTLADAAASSDEDFALPEPEAPDALTLQDPALEDVALGKPVAPSDVAIEAQDSVFVADAATDTGAISRIQREAKSIDEAERARFIVEELVQFACSSLKKEADTSARETASEAVSLALAEADDSAACQKLIFGQQESLIKILIRGLCELDEIPELVVPLTEIPFDEIDNRAAFLMTRIDGTLTLEEILDISGMPKLEALRHLERVRSLRYLRVL